MTTLTMMTQPQMCEYLFKHYAPAFNFEKDCEELFDLALKQGFVMQDKDCSGQYWIKEQR